MGRLPTADDLGFNHPSAGLAIVKQPESGLAEGLQTLGRTIAAIGARDRAEQEQLSKYKLKSDLEAFQWDQKIAYQQVFDTSAEDGSDIWARREAELQKVKKDWDKRPMSPEERAMVDDVFNGVMGQQRFAAYEDARTKRFAWQEKDIKWGADRTLSQGIPDQKTFDSWWNAQVAKIDSSGLPPEIKNKIKSEIATAGALKFGSDNPQGIIGAQKNTVSQFLTQRLVPAVQATENGPRDPRAVSKDGAIGLMQVTLRAAEDVAKKIGDEKFLRLDPAQRTEYLMNPDVNMKYGTAYLGMMLDKYRGDVETALIAYNAGGGNADKWLEAGRDYAILPRRGETEPYVQKVLANLGAAKLASGTAAAPGKTRIPVVTGTQPGRQPLDMSGLKPEVIDRWERVQGAFGRAVPIVSAYRDEARNKAAGGAKGSQHLHGNAIDVDVAGMTRAERVRLIETASAMGFTGIGVYANSLHFDTGNRRAWGPSHSFGSVPPWAYTVIAKHVAGKIKQDTSDGAASYAGGSVGGVPDGQENVTFVSNRKPTGGMWDYVSLDDWEKIRNSTIDSYKTSLKDSIDLGIEQSSIARDDIVNAPIDDGDKAILLRRWDERNKDAASVSDFVSRLNGGGFINPKDNKDRDAADLLLNGVGGAEAIASGDDKAVSAMFEIWDKAGLLPNGPKGAIEGMLRSKDQNKVNAALSYMDALDARNHRAFQQEFDEKSEALMLHYRDNLAFATPEESASTVMKSSDPVNDAIRKERGKEAEKTAAKLAIGDVMEKFDPSYFPFDQPDMPASNDTTDQLMADYRRLYVEAYKQSGDDEAAQKIAAKQLTRVWGAAAANGGRVMKYPPESLYGPSAMVDGSFDWMKDNVEKDLVAAGFFKKEDSVIAGGKGGAKHAEIKVPLQHFLLADRQTTVEAKAGKPASYQLWVIDENGAFDLVPKRVYFDVAPYRNASRATATVQQNMNLETRKQKDAVDSIAKRRQKILESGTRY